MKKKIGKIYHVQKIIKLNKKNFKKSKKNMGDGGPQKVGGRGLLGGWG
jgi:hypothetical protein